MGQVLHGCATTTEAVRRAIQNSQESLRKLAQRYGINQKTVAKWKKRETVTDLPTGPKEATSSVLSGGILSCRSTIASMPYRRRSRT
jgi:transposase-like protein